MDQVELSADDLARLAEVEPAFIQRAVQAGALQQREPPLFQQTLTAVYRRHRQHV